MNGLIYGWRFADSPGYFKCGRKQEILETFWITGHSKRKKSAAWVGIPSPLFIGLCLPGLMRPIFFFLFFSAEWKFPGCCGAVAGRMLMAEPCPWPRVGGRCCDHGGYCPCCHLSGPLAAPSFISSSSFLPSASPTWEWRSVLCMCPTPCSPSSEAQPCLLASGLSGQHLAHLLQYIFLKSSAS